MSQMAEATGLKPSGRLKVLISAYACCPHHGSEPEVGWGFSCAMAAHHDVWVVTRTAHRERIEKELQKRPVSGLHFIYYDPPDILGWGRHGGIRMQLHSWAWQFLAVSKVRKAHKEVRFDFAHHVTFAKYWAPSLLVFLDIPFFWGPVGGAEMTPQSLFGLLNRRERFFEGLKRFVSRAAEWDPFVRRTARRAAKAFASTPQTAARIRAMGCADVEVLTQIGISNVEAEPSFPMSGNCRFISVGRLIHWKGFLLGLMAFKASGLTDAEYHIVGDGPCRPEMERFAEENGLNVRFLGVLPTEKVKEELARADVLVHPSFHDSAGLVCLEALAAGRPVLCLDAGGPAELVDASCGVCVPVGSIRETVESLAKAMRHLGSDDETRRTMGLAGQERVKNTFTWKRRADMMAHSYIQWLSTKAAL